MAIVTELIDLTLFAFAFFGFSVAAPYLSTAMAYVFPSVVSDFRDIKDPGFVNYVDKSIPYFVLAMVVEVILSRRKESHKKKEGKPGNAGNSYSAHPYYRLNDGLNSMSLGMLQQMMHVGTFVKSLMIIPYIYVWENYAIYRLPETWQTQVLCFFAVEFGYYWFHRKAHEMNCFWAAHVTHHSSEEYNLTTATRQGAIQYGFAWVFYAPIGLFVPPTVYTVHSHFNRIYQFWIHTEMIRKFPAPIEYIFNTPSHHRVHHGANPYCIDTNYGGTLIIFDRMFGTFAAEDEPVVYGLVHNIDSWNPIWANIHHWVHMYEVSKSLSGLSKLRVLWKGPGWNPETGEEYPIPRVTPGQRKYDNSVHPRSYTYLIFQYFTALAAVKAIPALPDLAPSTVTLFLLHIVAVTFSIGLLNNNHPFARAFELARITATAGMTLVPIMYAPTEGWEDEHRKSRAQSAVAMSYFVCLLWFLTLSRRGHLVAQPSEDSSKDKKD